MTNRVSRLFAAALLILAALSVACADDGGISGHPIRELVPGDTILVTDQTGSLLGEFDEQGHRLTSVSLTPYGHARRDESNETRKHSGTIRDEASGLDHMGARFYATDFGLWTSADPLAWSAPEQQITAEFGAAHPYAYANHRPLIAADRDGEFWHVAVGALVGAAWGAGAEGLTQYLEHGRIVDTGRIQAAALGGGVAGGLVALNPAAGFVRLAAADVAGGLIERGAASGGRDVGTLGDAALDVAGSAGGKVLEVLGAAGKRAVGGLPDDTIVCRGGLCTVDRFASGTGVTLDDAGRIQGASVNAGPTFEAASKGVAHGQVGVTTAGQIRAAGGQVVASPSSKRPNHATLSGLTPEQAQQLFSPTVPNPTQSP